LQLSAFGLDPTVIVRFVSLAWPSLKEDIVEGGSKAAAERRAHIHRVREAWRSPAERKPAQSKPETRYFWFQPQLLGKWPGTDAGPEAFQKIDGSDLRSNLDHFVRTHCALINLTRLHKEVEAALVSVCGRDNPEHDFAEGSAR
jgi:hypothetical protein